MTHFAFGARSLRELRGVHPDLVDLATRALALSGQDFAIHDGLRTEAEQSEYVRRGVSKTLASRHLRQADGFGHAFDAVPWINGKLRWEWKPIFEIAGAMRMALATIAAERMEEGRAAPRIVWGGVWDRDLADLPVTAAEIEKAVNSYVARRRALGKTAFIDGPHFELAA